MKKGKTLIFTLIILLVLLLALYFIKSRNQNNVVPTTNISNPTLSNTSETNKNQTIVDYLSADLNEITVSKGDEALTYVTDGKTWSIKGHENQLINTDSVQNNCELLLHIKASRSIASTALKEFGLDQPIQTVAYSLKNGTTVKLLVGASTLDNANSYATFENQNGPVYIISSFFTNAFITNPNDLRNKELEEYDKTNITGLTASGTNVPNLTITPSKEQNSLLTSFDLTTPTLNKVLVDYDQFQALLDTLPTFTIEKFVADNVTDLSLYGLDKPQLHLCLEVTKEDNSEAGKTNTTVSKLDYLFGNKMSDGLIAFMKSGDTSVYAMDSSFLEPLIKALNPFTLSSKFIGLMNIDKVRGVDITTQKATYHFKIDEAKEAYSINNKTIEKDAFKTIYSALVKIQADQLMEEETLPTGSSAVMSFTYTLLDGTTKNYSFYNSSSSQFLLTQFNDAMTVGCSVKQFEYLESLINTAIGQ